MRLEAKTRAALMAEWAKLSPNLAVEPMNGESGQDAERRVRLGWANRQLCRAPDQGIRSFNELNGRQAKFLLKKMREESGSGPAYRAQLIARLAMELFGADWYRIILDRVIERFRIGRLEELSPAQAHAEIEELVSRLARRDGIEIEEARARYARREL